MRGFLKPLVKVLEVAALPVVNEDEGWLHDDDFRSLSMLPNLAVDLEFAYVSDIEFESDDVEKEEEIEEEPESEGPQRKWRKMLEVPAQEACRIACEQWKPSCQVQKRSG
jgi:hypothetical protein